MSEARNATRRAPLFEARGVSKRFGPVHALTAVSLDIHAGEVHAVLGENGAGKSTLMNVFCGRLTPTSGLLCREGGPVSFASPLDAQRAGIAMAPQEINLVPALTVAENVLLGAPEVDCLGNISWRRTRALAAERLAQIDPALDPDLRVGGPDQGAAAAGADRTRCC